MKFDKETLIDVAFAAGAIVFGIVAVMSAMSADALCAVALIALVGTFIFGLSEND